MSRYLNTLTGQILRKTYSLVVEDINEIAFLKPDDTLIAIEKDRVKKYLILITDTNKECIEILYD